MAAPNLDAGEIIATIERLGKRIEERVPGSGLVALCGQLLDIARQARARSREIARPHVPLRIAVGALLALIAAGLAVTAARVEMPRGSLDLVELVQLLEAPPPSARAWPRGTWAAACR